MFAEPLSITVNAVAKSLNRTAFGDRKGTFYSAVDGLKLSVTHTSGKRENSVVRFDIEKIAADPLLDGVSKPYSMSVFLTVNRPLVGFSIAEQNQLVQALIDWADVPANLSKVLNGES